MAPILASGDAAADRPQVPVAWSQVQDCRPLGTVTMTSLDRVIGNFGWSLILLAFGALALCVFLVDSESPWLDLRTGLAPTTLALGFLNI